MIAKKTLGIIALLLLTAGCVAPPPTLLDTIHQALRCRSSAADGSRPKALFRCSPRLGGCGGRQARETISALEGVPTGELRRVSGNMRLLLTAGSP